MPRGNPNWIAPTRPLGTSDNSVATTAFVGSAIAAIPADSSANTITKLTAQTNFYVASSGSDSNTGLASSVPWATIQHSVDEVLKYNLNGNQAIINILDGTYNEGSGVELVGPYIGGKNGYIWLFGNQSTPNNIQIIPGSSTGENAIYVSDCFAKVSGVTVRSSTRDGIAVVQAGWVQCDNIRFRDCRYHLRADYGGIIQMSTGDVIAGDATGAHYYAKNGGILEAFDHTVNVVNPVTMTSFCQAQFGRMEAIGISFTGSAVTGARFIVTENGVISTNGGGFNFFPGTSSGVIGSGDNWGVYV